MSVIVEIAHAGGLRPTRPRQAGLLTYLGEMALAVVAVEMGTGGGAGGIQRGSIGDEDIVGAVAVVVEDGAACSGAFEEVIFLFFSTEGGGQDQSGSSCDVDEVRPAGLREEKRGSDHSDHGRSHRNFHRPPSC